MSQSSLRLYSFFFFFILFLYYLLQQRFPSFCLPGLEKEMATRSSILPWKIPWMEEPGRLQCMGSQRFRHDWATSLSLFTFMHWRRKWQPTPVFLPGVAGMGESGGLQSTGSHRVGQDWSDLAAAAESMRLLEMLGNKEYKHMKWRYKWHASC